MALATAESLKAQLDIFCISCEDDSVLERVEQCICHRIQEDDMVCEWMAYNSRNPKPLTMNTLEQFEHEVLNKRNKFKSGLKKEEPYNKTMDINTLQDIKAEEEEENLLDSYSTPAKGSQKRPLTTPEHPQSKRSAALLASPGLLLSPASFSAATPSQKYNQRGAKGEVVVTFGATQGTRWAGRKSPAAGVQVDFLEGPEDSLHSSYKFMFQRLRDVRNLAEKIEDLGETVRSHFHIEEFASVSLPAQDSITVSGQICCDSNGKLNAQSVLLEAGPEHGGQQVAVDLSELKEYSLFPGQVVVMEGMNTTGKKLVASKIYEGVPLPFYSSDIKTEADEAEPLNVLVACGPYTPSDSLTFDPLLDLISVITRDRPDVCLMLGPFVDSRHEQIEKGQVTETFEAIFSRCIESIVDGTRVGCHLVFVPSQRDVHHPLIYPQPPFTLPHLSKNQRITLVPDPCTLLIDGVTFGLTSTDILFHMGAEEISGSGSDRFSRILKHMLVQRYYPLYPPAEEVNMDYEKFQSFAQIPLIPDVLIVPSELRYFIKDVLGCVCLNPGRLTKGQVGGTYGRLLLQRSAAPEGGQRRSPCLAAQVVKI
uniref:DNA polymerase alpha subunit B n=1 Tax=Oryzias latipes TaxID=8090 RepID=A0A3P9L968_ORYLA